MKKLLKKSISFFLSLSLILGLITTPTMVAKATTTSDESVDLENYNDITFAPSNINNTAPQAMNVDIIPDSFGEYLEGDYDFLDAEENVEGKSLFKWYRSDEIDGIEEAIPCATEKLYYIGEEDYGKYLRFEVTPIEEGLVGLIGIPVKSSFYAIIKDDNNSDDADELDNLKVAIESYKGGADHPVFEAEVNKSEKTVTVTGISSMSNETLAITIPADVKVIWKAELSGNGNGGKLDLLRVDGQGSFELAENGSITVVDYDSVYDHNAIIAGEELFSILVTGGDINAYSGHAIFASGENTTVEVLGGNINSMKGDTIYTSGSNSVVKISGGTVNSSNGASINSNGDVLISGGKIDNNKGWAIYAGDSVTVSGTGLVVSAQGTAIQLKKVGIIEITGGVVFAGSDMNNNDMSVYKIPNGTKVLYSEGNGTMISWERTNKRMSYPYGSKFDLYTFKSPSKVTWTIDMGRPGVLIDNGIYKAFVPTYGITITDMPETPVIRIVTFIGGLDSIIKSVTSGASLGMDNWPVNPVKTGYTFSGWYTGENGSGTVFIPNTLVNADITVYA
ncbi:MAG: uncharacterized protein K0S61_4443, partial [Anaerocolumna sp.]|nr:uncharacterized protein [Anaerocolumna sp.]